MSRPRKAPDSRVKTKRLADPVEPSDGARVLIARYRPRGVKKSAETWQRWDKRLAPSVALVDAWYGKRRRGGKLVGKTAPIAWDEYRRRFAEEMASGEARAALAEYAARAAAGEVITLLCYCPDPERCHRGLVAQMLTSRADAS